ncbi:MAG TPA: hypothetical protein VEY30_08330 [Myxococcaceae bacterium]|nr:hypothetical protein [Myxococcaceae bacterium]
MHTERAVPRTYSYDHFQVPEAHPNAGSEVKSRNRSKVADPASDVSPPQAHGIHYGRAHAETAERYQRRHAEAEQRSAAGNEGGDDGARHEASAPAPAEAGTPIGSLPGTDRPWADDFRGLWGELQGTLEMMGGAVRDLHSGAQRLARLPRNAAKMALGRLQRARA